MKYPLAILFNLWKLYIGVVFAITLILFYPFFIFILWNENLKKIAFPINIFWSRVMRILCFYAIELEGTNDKKDKPFIICANHTSYLDIFFMYSIIPNNRFLFMGKSEILSYPLVKTFFKKLNIPVDRSNRIKAAKSFIQARNAMVKDWSIVIFPEGGIPDETPYLIPFKNGTFHLAKAAKVGILPITFVNNHRLFSDPEAVFGSAMPGLARISIHPFISEEEVARMNPSAMNKRVYDEINTSLPQKNH